MKCKFSRRIALRDAMRGCNALQARERLEELLPMIYHRKESVSAAMLNCIAVAGDDTRGDYATST